MDRPPTLHRFNRRDVYGDYGRAAAGLALTLGPLLATGATGVAAYVLAGLAAVFALFALRTLQRQRMTVRVDDQGVSTDGMRQVIVRWEGLRRVKLSYFSTRRDRQRGWMQLTLRGDRGTLKLDSQLDGFDDLVECTAAALNARAIKVSDSTAANFAAYGHGVPSAGFLAGDEPSRDRPDGPGGAAG